MSEESRGEYVPALVIESRVTPEQRERNYALYSRLYHGVPPEKRTGESREGIGLHMFQFSVPIEDVSIGMREVSFRLNPESECLRRLCSYISDHFDSSCAADADHARCVHALRRLLPLLDKLGYLTHEEQAAVREARLAAKEQAP